MRGGGEGVSLSLSSSSPGGKIVVRDGGNCHQQADDGGVIINPI